MRRILGSPVIASQRLNMGSGLWSSLVDHKESFYYRVLFLQREALAPSIDGPKKNIVQFWPSGIGKIQINVLFQPLAESIRNHVCSLKRKMVFLISERKFFELPIFTAGEIDT